jgi:Mitochondrial carrier protein
MSEQQQSTAECGSSNCSKSALTARIVSGSIGSILTSLIVTPLEVVKVRTQATAGVIVPEDSAASVNQQRPAATSSRTTTTTTSRIPRGVIPCPRGCGTFVLFNGQMECTLPKSCVPYFDHVTGQLLRTPAAASSNLYRNSTSTSSLGTFAMVRRIFAQEGLPGIYAGLRPTLVMGTLLFCCG